MVTIRVSTHQWEGSASIVETSSLTPQRWSLTRSAAPAWSSIYVAEWALLENVTFLDAHDVAEVITSTADHIDGVRVINRDNDNSSFLTADMVVDAMGAPPEHQRYWKPSATVDHPSANRSSSMTVDLPTPRPPIRQFIHGLNR
jgi:hypothetical protein